jgi:molecular chaperone GrpE
MHKDKKKTTPETHGHEHHAAEEAAEKNAAEEQAIDEGTAQQAGAAAEKDAASHEKLVRVEKERDEYLDLARRARADYVNLQRRMETQRDSVRDETRHEFAKAMLSILDDLENALKHAREGGDVAAIVHGLEIVRTNFLATLSRYGIEPMAAEGAQFDHNVHHAIAEHTTDAAEPGTVFAVALKGYTSGGKLLRPAHVVVAKKPAGQEPPQGEGADRAEEKLEQEKREE